MTNQRFIFENEDLKFGIKDNGKYISVVDCVNLLNKLNDENEQLKEIITDQRDTIKRDNKWENKAIGEINEFLENNGIAILLEENEKLKSENEKQFTALKRMCDVEICQICEHNELLFQQTPYGDEYDTRCKKGLFYGVEVQVCDDWELCKELYE